MIDLVQVGSNINIKGTLYVIKKSDFYIISNGEWILSFNKELTKGLEGKISKAFRELKEVNGIENGKVVEENKMKAIETFILSKYKECRQYHSKDYIDTGLENIEDERVRIMWNTTDKTYMGVKSEHINMVRLKEAEIISSQGAFEPIYFRKGVEEVIIYPYVLSKDKMRFIKEC